MLVEGLVDQVVWPEGGQSPSNLDNLALEVDIIDNSPPEHFHSPLTDSQGPILIQVGEFPPREKSVSLYHLSRFGMANMADSSGARRVGGRR